MKPRRFAAALTAAAAALATSALVTAPATAGPGTASGADWSITMSFPDMQWAADSCQAVPVTAVVTGATVEEWSFGGFVLGENSSNSGFLDYDELSGTGPGTFHFRHAVALCSSWADEGLFTVTGEAGVRLTGAVDWAWVPFQASFTVVGVNTVTTLDDIALVGPQAKFTGRVAPVAPLSLGARCRGEVAIQTPSEDEWEWVGSGDLAADGTFVVTTRISEVQGVELRASFEPSGHVCEGSQSAARALGVKLPRASAWSIHNGSVAWVDVDPDLGGGKSWLFQVERRIADDLWKKLGKYTTRGSHETRSVNLPKGTYRIHVLPRHGFAETYSDEFGVSR